MKITKVIGLIIAFSICANTFAKLGNRTSEITLNPSVKIIREQIGDGIEIVTDKKEYTTNYDVGGGTFLPMVMGFNVVSTKNRQIEYKLTLNVQNYCREEGTTNDQKMKDVKYFLDGESVIPSLRTNEITTGTFLTNNERWHQFMIKFPRIPQDNTYKMCYGFVGITAMLTNTY
ncbi:hypothetical protein [Photobacterium leiognathi]|uniref:hypothetical protein n=1 Tax=Photobacterium leiognathi TaxID=553611 RepID=UPI00273838C0|nr:hypothetical protein [Photobacterium leiognathi]